MGHLRATRDDARGRAAAEDDVVAMSEAAKLMIGIGIGATDVLAPVVGQSTAKAIAIGPEQI